MTEPRSKRIREPALLRLVQWVFPKIERLAPRLAGRIFVTIFFTPLKYKAPEKERELARRARLTSVRLANGRQVQLYQWGQGPCILFVHGWAGRGTQFRKFIEYVAEHGYMAAAVDGPAHGRSEGSKTNLLEFAEAIEKCVRVLKPVGIIAHSFGGVASLYAVVHGLPVRVVVCIASPSIGDEIINTYLRAVRGSQKTGDAIREYVLQAMNQSFDAFTSSHFMKNFSGPLSLLLVQDEDDGDVIPAHAFVLKEVYPAAELFITKGLGHTRILKDQEVITRCVTFIAGRASV